MGDGGRGTQTRGWAAGRRPAGDEAAPAPPFACAGVAEEPAAPAVRRGLGLAGARLRVLIQSTAADGPSKRSCTTKLTARRRPCYAPGQVSTGEREEPLETAGAAPGRGGPPRPILQARGGSPRSGASAPGRNGPGPPLPSPGSVRPGASAVTPAGARTTSARLRAPSRRHRAYSTGSRSLIPRKPITVSTGSRSPIPREADQSFQTKPIKPIVGCFFNGDGIILNFQLRRRRADASSQDVDEKSQRSAKAQVSGREESPRNRGCLFNIPFYSGRLSHACQSERGGVAAHG